MSLSQRPLRIGLVDLDTSHPQAWIPVLRDLGHEIAGVYDGGTVYPEGYARQFAEKNAIPHVYDSPRAMAASPDIDLAIVHSCNWDVHVRRARPFVEAGKPVLIDKPVAGNIADLNQFRAWISAGARIAGGSSLRYCPEVTEYQSRQAEPAVSLFAGCGVDEFNYGIHAYSLTSGLMGPGITRVRHLGIHHKLHAVELAWADDRRAQLLLAGESWLPFHATLIGKGAVQQLEVKIDSLYRALLEHVLPYLGGAADAPPTPFEDWIEPELAALAAHTSHLRRGAWISLDQLSEADEGYDGAAFGRSYRESKLGAAK